MGERSISRGRGGLQSDLVMNEEDRLHYGLGEARMGITGLFPFPLKRSKGLLHVFKQLLNLDKIMHFSSAG